MKRMKSSKVESSLNLSLNDSDDFVTRSHSQKRKLKPVSPKPKRRKVNGRTDSKSVTLNSQEAIKPARKPPMNRTDPLPKTRQNKKEAVTIPSPKKNESADIVEVIPLEKTEEESGRREQCDTSSKETENSENPQSSQTQLPAVCHDAEERDEDLFKKNTAKKAKESAVIRTFVCPLCAKTVENKFTHVSHMKQCAKKKKISTAQLLQTIDNQASKDLSKPIALDTAKPSTSQQDFSQGSRETPETTFELALAAALSLSLNKPSSSGHLFKVDKNVVDSQKTTLEKFGFTTTTSASGKITRRGKAQKNRSSVLRVRTADERMRILTEKAAVILLTEQDAALERDGSPGGRLHSHANDDSLSQSVPKLWGLGESEGSGPWYVNQLKEHVTPQSSAKSTQAKVSTIKQTDSLETSALDSSAIACGSKEIDLKEDVSQNSLSDDWDKLVGSLDWSDATIETQDGHVPIHSLVLRVRCPGLELEHLAGPCLQVTCSALLLLLKYIYTGILGHVPSADLQMAKLLAEAFRRPDLVASLSTVDATTSDHSSSHSGDIIPSSLSPTLPRKGDSLADLHGGCNSSLITSEEVKGEHVPTPDPSINPQRVAVEEADTVPVTEMYVDLAGDEKQEPEVDEQECWSEIVDLTQSGNASPGSDSAQRSYWSMMRRDLDQKLRSEKELEEDHLDAQELTKIQNFIDRQSSEQDLMEDHDYKEDQKEMVKIYNLSRSSHEIEADLFADHYEVEVVPNPPNEIIVVSSDSEQHGSFDDSTDEEITPAPVSKLERFEDESLDDLPLFGSPEGDAFIDYKQTANLNDVTSQSLVVAAGSPRTPRKVLGRVTPVAPTPPPPSPPKSEELVTEGSSPAALPEPEVSYADLPTTPIAAAVESMATPKGRSSLRGRRRSASWRTGSKFVRRSVRALNERGRRSLLAGKPTKRTKGETSASVDTVEPLTTSLLAGMDESWRGSSTSPRTDPMGNSTPSSPGRPNVRITPTVPGRPFIEVTPRATPSQKLVDKVTPQPNFSAMKTVSLKKQLQKYGLKRGLGRVKAKKILKHIYDELHPIVNERTGKIVKFLPEVKPTRGGRKGAKAKPTGVARGAKIRSSPRRKPKQKPTEIVQNVAGPSGLGKKVGSRSDNAKSGKSKADEPDLNTSFTDGNSSEDSEDGDEFGCVDVEVLTQSSVPSKSVDAALSAYIKSNLPLFRQILCYQPIWIEAFRKDAQAALNTKIPLSAVMAFLDKKCITFRSETQAANVKKRNERRKDRRIKKAAKRKTAD